MPALDLGKLRKVKGRELMVRFVFGAAISVGAAVIAKVTSPRFGGAFLAFPAILPASLTLIQDKEGTRKADRNAIGAVLGGFGLAVFAAIGESRFGHLAPAVVLLAALAGWAAMSVALYGLLAFLVPDACDAEQD